MELVKRPTYLDLHLKGAVDSNQFRQEFNSYLGFLEWAKELTSKEVQTLERYRIWFEEVEKISMNKS